jgi:hypothetical protein
MSKQNALGANFYIGGNNIGGDVGSVAISGGPALLDVTDITQSAVSRLGGLRDGKMDLSVYFDPATAHPVLSALPTADTIATFMVPALAVGSPAACMNAKQVNYDPTRGTDGSFIFTVNTVSNGFGLEWGVALTAGLRTDTTATTGAFYDQGASGSNGCQAYLQLTAFSGTSVDVTVTHATTSGGSYSTLVDFGAQTAPGSFRVTAAGTVNEFLKVVTAGTFSSATFAVVFMLNKTSVVF